MRIYGIFIKNTLIREMEFRLNFFIWGVAMLVEFGIHFLFFHNLYGSVEEIAGWNRYEWLFYLGFVQLMLAVFMVFLFPNLVALPWRINSGELDYFLLKPVNTQFLVSLGNMNFGYLVNIAAGMILMGYGSAGLQLQIDIQEAAGALFFALTGTLILYSIFFNVSILAIWLKKADFASALFFNLWSFMRQPSSVYGDIAGIFLTYFFPVLLICTPSAEILLGRARPATLSLAFLIGLVWFGGSILLWKRAVRRYSSAGS